MAGLQSPLRAGQTVAPRVAFGGRVALGHCDVDELEAAREIAHPVGRPRCTGAKTGHERRQRWNPPARLALAHELIANRVHHEPAEVLDEIGVLRCCDAARRFTRMSRDCDQQASGELLHLLDDQLVLVVDRSELIRWVIEKAEQVLERRVRQHFHYPYQGSQARGGYRSRIFGGQPGALHDFANGFLGLAIRIAGEHPVMHARPGRLLQDPGNPRARRRQADVLDARRDHVHRRAEDFTIRIDVVQETDRIRARLLKFVGARRAMQRPRLDVDRIAARSIARLLAMRVGGHEEFFEAVASHVPVHVIERLRHAAAKLRRGGVHEAREQGIGKQQR